LLPILVELKSHYSSKTYNELKILFGAGALNTNPQRQQVSLARGTHLLALRVCIGAPPVVRWLTLLRSHCQLKTILGKP